MNILRYTLAASILLSAFVDTVSALEVDRGVMPRITLGGRVLTTLDSVERDSEPDHKGGVNLSDSALLLRFDKRMFRKGVAGAVVGFQEAGDDDSGVRMHELHTFYWDRDQSFLLGRSRLRNTIIEFPLLRDDDLLDYTHVGNASSNEEYDQIVGNQFVYNWHADKKIQQYSLWAATRNNEAAMTGAPDGFDSAGVGYNYEQPEDLRYVKRIRHAGFLFDRQRVNRGNGVDWMNAMVAGIEFNLNRNPLANWSVAVQGVVNQGAGDVALSDIAVGATNAVSSRAAAKSDALVASIRYTSRPHLLTRWQGGLAIARKNFSDFSDATQWSIAPSFFYRIGQGVELLGQAMYTDYSDDPGGGRDMTLQLGIAFSLESIFNDTIGERNSILNLEHGYIN